MADLPLTEYAVVDICRSDGQDTGPGYWPTPFDAATKTAKKTPLDKAPRTKPYMVRLSEDDTKFQEWRVKLGILLKQELTPNEGLPWLVNFPRGYWLYEKSKHLWVSGYPVKTKLYKTPQEFAIHLLWLLSSSTDRMDCHCIHCNIRDVPSYDDLVLVEQPRPLPASMNALPPSKMRKITPQLPLSRTASPAPSPVPNSAKKETMAPVPTPAKKETPVPVPAIPARVASVLATDALAHPVQSQVQAQTQAPAPGQTSVVAQARVQTPQQPQQAVAPAPYQQSQFHPYPPPYIGIQPNALFRVGEMVWFQMTSGWRLGVIAASIMNPTTNKYDKLQLLPISHHLFAQSPVQQPEATTRPFLAFSVPGVSIPEIQNKPYDDVPWDSFLATLSTSDTHQREVALLDSSKMAAQKVAQSYSLFSRVAETPDGKKTDYNGIFLGAERVELCDALRIRISNEQGLPAGATTLADALLGLREICTAVDMPGAVFFKGDIYQPLIGDAQPVIPNSPIVPEDKLPRPLREESVFRNKYAPAERWRCVLLRQNAVLREQDLKGRFYPTHKLLPLLEGQQKVGAEVQQGIIRDVQHRLNQRIDIIKAGGYIGRKKNRVDTVGPALPPGSAIQFGPEVREEDV